MSATALASVDNKTVVRCDVCRLVQYRGENSLCRRCRTPLEKTAEPKTSPACIVVVSAPRPGGLVAYLPEIIRRRRLKLGLSQKALAQRVGCKRQNVSKTENGKCSSGFLNLQRYARGLDTRGSSLIALIENPKAELAKPLGCVGQTIVHYVGRTVRALREEAHKSQHDIEVSTGMKRTYLSHVETGKTIPSLTFFEKFAPAIGKSVSAVIAEIENASFPN